MNRRTLLHAGIAAPVAGLIQAQLFAPAEAQLTSAPSPLDALLQEWQETRDTYNAHPSDDDEEAQAILARHHAAEEAIAAAPVETLRDLAIKVVAADDGGDMLGYPQSEALLFDAWRIVYGASHPQEGAA